MPHYKDLFNSLHSLTDDDIKNGWESRLPSGSIRISDEEAEQLRQAAIPAPTLKDYDIAIEQHLDAEAEAAGYYDPLGRIPNIDRACSYAGYVNQYQAESQSFVAWRAAVWAHAFQVKSDVEANIRAQPTIEELIAELPARVIPE